MITRTVITITVLLFPLDFIGQCGLKLDFSGYNDIDYLKITVDDSSTWHTYNDHIFVPSKCNVPIKLRVKTGFYELYDTTLIAKNKSQDLQINLQPIYIIQDTFEIHSHENKSEFKNVQEVIENENIKSGSELFSTFSAIKMTTKSSGVNKPVMRFFHSQRLTILENNLPLRDHTWGLDHGLETGLSHIYGVNYNTTSSPIYADYGALFINQDIYHQVLNSKVKLGYNHVNQDKSIGFTLPHKFKKLYVNLSGDLDLSNNYKVPSDQFSYLGSYYKLINQQLSNTGKRHNFVSFDVKKDEIFSFGISNKWSKTAFFAGGLGIPNSYDLNNQQKIQLPYQTMNHIKFHGHYNTHINTQSEFHADIALQNNRRKEYEVPANHGYNPLSTDSLGIDLNFTNLDILFGLKTHIDSTLCLTIENSSNIGQNKTEGFDFIIPSYQQIENRLRIDLETIQNKKRSFNTNVSIKTKNYNIEFSEVTMYRGSTIIGDIETSKAEKIDFGTIDFFLKYKHKFNKKLNGEISAATVGRTPEINELSSFGAHHGSFRFEKGNRNLENERNINLQTMLEFNQKKLNTRFRAYWYEFQNYIYLTPSNKFTTTTINDSLIALPVTGQLYEYKQTRSRMIGAELDAEYKLGNWKWEFQGFLTYAQNLTTGLPLPFIAPASVKNTFSYRKEKIGKKWSNLITTIEFINNAKQERVDRNENKTPASFVTNISSSISYLTNKSRVDLSIGIENLWNNTYYVHLSEYRILNIPEPSRNIFARLSYNF